MGDEQGARDVLQRRAHEPRRAPEDRVRAHLVPPRTAHRDGHRGTGAAQAGQGGSEGMEAAADRGGRAGGQGDGSYRLRPEGFAGGGGEREEGEHRRGGLRVLRVHQPGLAQPAGARGDHVQALRGCDRDQGRVPVHLHLLRAGVVLGHQLGRFREGYPLVPADCPEQKEVPRTRKRGTPAPFAVLRGGKRSIR